MDDPTLLALATQARTLLASLDPFHCWGPAGALVDWIDLGVWDAPSPLGAVVVDGRRVALSKAALSQSSPERAAGMALAGLRACCSLQVGALPEPSAWGLAPLGGFEGRVDALSVARMDALAPGASWIKAPQGLENRGWERMLEELAQTLQEADRRESPEHDPCWGRFGRWLSSQGLRSGALIHTHYGVDFLGPSLDQTLETLAPKLLALEEQAALAAAIESPGQGGARRL
jgi:hypothetical protein